MDKTTAYYRPEPSYDARLAEVGRGTSMGELLRRYWLPIALSSKATDLPAKVRALGEDLLLFRDRSGRPGLLHPRCCHRGTSLFYGAVREHGIQCCYHGWMFDVEGRVIERPAEPNPGPINAFRQPWYPLEERYGLIWAYMGPSDRKPLLPRYDVLEELDEGETVWADDGNIGGTGNWEPGEPFPEECAFNWFQGYENIHDPAHFYWLHYLHSGSQFGERLGDIDIDRMRAELPVLLRTSKFEVSDRGVLQRRRAELAGGRSLMTIVEAVLPTVRVIPNPFGKEGRCDALGFVLPVDDTHFRIFTAMRAKDAGWFEQMHEAHEQLAQMSVEDRQRTPGDFEAQGSQGDITFHSEEHLGSSDRGIVMLRRLFEDQMAIVEAGGDPIGVRFAPQDDLVRLEGGAFISAAPTPNDTSPVLA